MSTPAPLHGANGFQFVEVVFDTTEQLLLRGDGPTVAPVTLSVINGSVLRGVLAQRCDPAQLDRVIVSGDVAVAPGFPMVETNDTLFPAFPTPRTLRRVKARGGDHDLAHDARTDYAGSDTPESVRGLAAFTGIDWVPARTRTRTHTRLVRPRAGGASTGFGPISFTVLEPGHQFRAWFRISGDPARQADLREDIHALLDTDRRQGELVRFGSGADGSYGGDAIVTVGRLSDSPVSLPVRSTEPHEEVDLVLHSPALLTDPSNGATNPNALGDHVRTLLHRFGFDAAAHGVSVVRSQVGGAHAGYGRMRPARWAAGAGSVVTVAVSAEVSGHDWTRVLAHRVGDRVIDGLGILAMVPRTSGVRVHDAIACHIPRAAHTTPGDIDEKAAAQLELLQEHLFDTAVQRWVRGTAETLVATTLTTGTNGLGVSLLGRLRTALDTPDDLLALLDSFAPEPGESPGPVQATLNGIQVGTTSLGAWLRAAASPQRADDAWQALPADDQAACTQPLATVDLGGPTTVPLWLDSHRHAIMFALARAVVLTFQRARTTEEAIP
ncbi:hypothetical protein [Nocardia sp. NPDC058705]|uniref:hypothetical protein n=1 Tax=Nocardia sp. NPDC058705 TaxID=3346609 RepID=UPI00368AEA1E